MQQSRWHEQHDDYDGSLKAVRHQQRALCSCNVYTVSCKASDQIPPTHSDSRVCSCACRDLSLSGVLLAFHACGPLSFCRSVSVSIFLYLSFLFLFSSIAASTLLAISSIDSFCFAASAHRCTRCLAKETALRRACIKIAAFT